MPAHAARPAGAGCPGVPAEPVSRVRPRCHALTHVLAVVYVVAVLVVAFALSGVVPTFSQIRARRRRVEQFAEKYAAWADADADVLDHEDWIGKAVPDDLAEASETGSKEADELKPWLTARCNEMQRDAQAVGHGIVRIAPPPAIGGAISSFGVYDDLFDRQAYADQLVGTSFRRQDLATIIYETQKQEDEARRAIVEPWSWVRLAFERVVRFPAYVLRVSGFGVGVTESTGVRVVSALWSFAVGVATIGAFVVVLINN